MFVSLSIAGAGVLFNSPRPGSGIAWISRFASTSTRRARARLPVSKTTVPCCAAVPRRRSGARCHAKLALARGAMGVARSIATLGLFILKKECCCFFVCASGLVVVVVVARREGISPPTENPNHESRRIQTRNPARQTAKREESQNQTGESDLEMFAFFTDAYRGPGRGVRAWVLVQVTRAFWVSLSACWLSQRLASRLDLLFPVCFWC